MNIIKPDEFGDLAIYRKQAWCDKCSSWVDPYNKRARRFNTMFAFRDKAGHFVSAIFLQTNHIKYI